MKKLYTSLLAIITAAFFTQQTMARPFLSTDYFENELSDYLDLEAVVDVFSRSRNLVDFEYQLNDFRNAVSNLDLNGDGFVDYLRVVKLSDRRAHIILIQAVLGRDFYQDVATITVGRDRYNREYVHVIGDPGLYGFDYIIEPVFHRRPPIVRWIWNNSPNVFVSRYHWGYYPSHFHFRPIVAVHVYHHHIYSFRNPRLQFHIHTHRVHPLPIEVMRQYKRNDFWRSNEHLQFENRHQNIRNRTQLPPRTALPDPPARQPETRSSENERRGSGSVTPQRAEPQRSTPQRTEPQQRAEPQRSERQPVSPQGVQSQRNQNTQPARNTQESTPSRDNQQNRERNDNSENSTRRGNSPSSPRR